MTRAAYNEHMRHYMLKRYHERREQILEKLGGRCYQCGSTDDLELDHKDPKKKKINLARRLSSISQIKLDEELKKVQLLCRECHQEKTIDDQGFKRAKGKHGTISTYRWCGPPKCEACKKARRDYMREYRKKQRTVSD